MILIHFFISAALAFNFRITDPLINAETLVGSQVIIKWTLDNVTLPLDDVNVNLDLYRVRQPDTLYSSIAEHVPNIGEYVWTIPYDLPSALSGYKIRVGPSQRSDDHKPFITDVFYIRHEYGRRANFIEILEPVKDSQIFPGAEVRLKWSKGSAGPSFPWGVHVEYREPLGKSFLTIARNVSFRGNKEAAIQWTPPVEPFAAPSNHLLTGRLFVWGFDINSKSIVFSDNMNMTINYVDQIPLTLSILSPAATDILVVDSLETMVVSMMEKDSKLPVLGRDSHISIYIEDDQERTLLQLFNGHGPNWSGNTALIPWKIPDAEKLQLSGNSHGSESPQDVFGLQAARTCRLRFEGTYKAVEPGRELALLVYSDYFIVSTDGKPKRPPDGGQGEILKPSIASLSSLAAVIALLHA